MANLIPKIEYGLGPTIVTFEFPPEGDYIRESLDASETTSRSFNGNIQTTWGYNQQTISPHFKLVNHDIKNKVDLFFQNWASLGNFFKYFPSSDGATFYNVVSSNKKLSPKILAIQSHDDATKTTKFFWEFDIPMIVIAPGQTAVSGAPVTSVNTRLGDVFVREIYNQSETDTIAVGTDTGLDAKIITVPDTTSLIPEIGRIAFTTDVNAFRGYDGTSWVVLGGGGGGGVTTPPITVINQLAMWGDTAGSILTKSAYTFPIADGLANQMLQTDGAGAITFVNAPTGAGITTPAVTALNQVALYGDLTGDTLLNTAYTIPLADGLANQVLRTNGAGVVSFATIPTPPTPIATPPATVVNRIALWGDGTGDTLISTAYGLPTIDGTANQILKTDGIGVLTWQDDIDTTSIGDVVGPGGATDNAFAVYDGATGKLLKDSTVTTATITGMQTNITTLQTDLTTVQGDITTIQGDITNIQSSIGVVGSTQAVVAAGQIIITIDPFQSIELTSIAPITLATEIFIVPVGLLDRTEITLLGTDDTNKITIASSDTLNGQIMFGGINIKRFTSITFAWNAGQTRFIEKCRNSQSVITAI